MACNWALKNWAITLLASILILGSLGLSQEAFAVNTSISDQATCENAPVLGTFDSGTCVLSGTHTIPLGDEWLFSIESEVTGTVNVNGFLRFTTTFSNSGTINVIGDPSGTASRGHVQFLVGTDYTNECVGIFNLIGGTGLQSGTLSLSGQAGSAPIFNNFGTITGTNSNLGPATNIAVVLLISSNPFIVVFNNHGTLTAPVDTTTFGGIFNDNLPNQCDEPVGGTLIPIDTTTLLLAGMQSISMWLIPVVAAGVAIGIFMIKRRK